MTAHSAHYPTFIEHPDDPEKRALVKTPWLHHKQLLDWGLEGLTPVPEAPANDPSTKPVHDPVYPKWIENPKTHSRKLVANAKDEKAQLEAWGIDVDDEDDDERDDPPATVGYRGPTPLDQIDVAKPKPATNGAKPIMSRDQRRAEAKKQKEADAARNRQ